MLILDFNLMQLSLIECLRPFCKVVGTWHCPNWNYLETDMPVLITVSMAVDSYSCQSCISSFWPFHSTCTQKWIELQHCNIEWQRVSSCPQGWAGRASEETRDNWLLILRFNEKRLIGWFGQSEVIVRGPSAGTWSARSRPSERSHATSRVSAERCKPAGLPDGLSLKLNKVQCKQ